MKIRLLQLYGSNAFSKSTAALSSNVQYVAGSNLLPKPAMSLLPLISLTEQSPRAFGHINTQAYGKTKVQSEEELSEVRLLILK